MNALGINLTSILAQVVNFTILFLVLKKFVFQTIVKVIEKQKEKLKTADEADKRIQARLDKLEKDKTQQMDRAKKEGLQVIDQAKKDGTEQKKEIIAQAKEEAQQIIKEAQAEIKAAKEANLKEAAKKAQLTAMEQAASLVAQSLNTKDQRLLIKQSLARLKKLSL